MTVGCDEFEVLLADWIDGNLPGDSREAFEQHLRECSGCAGLAEDAKAVAGLFQEVPAPEPPRELLTRIAFQIPARATAEAGGWRTAVKRWFHPVLEPRFAMGMAMTVLSFSMLGRLAGIEVRQLKPSDLNPVQVWASVEDKAHRAWDRGVKYYENLRVVFEVQTRLREWTEQEEAERRSQAAEPAGKPAPAQTNQKTEGSAK